MLIYSGLRAGEFMSLTPADVDTDSRFITVRKSKTAAGKRRIPIPQKTLLFWQTRKDNPSPDGFLISADCPPQADPRYKALRARFEAIFAADGLLPHLPHDTRHTTASLLHAAGIEPYTVKRILGHSTQDVTEAVYTHISDAALLEAIDRI